MRLCKILSSAAAAALFILTPAFGGTLMSGTLVQPGDLTIDTNQNLEFLALSDTKGLSYTQALATSYVKQSGFRTATLSEFEQLATDAGVIDLSATFTPANYAGVQTLISLLGSTISMPTALPDGNTIAKGFYGFLNAPNVPPGYVDVSGADYQSAALGEAAQDQARVAPNFNQLAVDKPAPIAGTFLVRAVTPEPASVGFIGLGFSLLAASWMFRRRFSHIRSSN